MNRKVLITAHMASMIYKFNLDNICTLRGLGYEVEVAANFGPKNPLSEEEMSQFIDFMDDRTIRRYETNCPRSPMRIKKLIQAYREYKRILDRQEYQFIHCQSPTGGVLARLAVMACKKDKKPKIIYTAHGFHFFKGAPLLNWIFYYPVERFLAGKTDVLVTINKEDYYRAKRFGAKTVVRIPGVGLEWKKNLGRKEDLEWKKDIEADFDREEYRKNLNIPADAFVVLSVGELNRNKNHEVVLKALRKLNAGDVYYIIAGKGPCEKRLNSMIRKYGLCGRVRLLGYREDVRELCKMSDIFAFPSKREGLGMAALEAMSEGLPVVGTHIHGINDYLIDGKTGFGCRAGDVGGFARAIRTLYQDKKRLTCIGGYNRRFAKKFSREKARDIMKKIYEELGSER